MSDQGKRNKIYKIYVSDYEIEVPIETPKGNYRVDILLMFKKSEPEFLALKWRNKVAVEIYVAHKTEPIKIKDLKSVGIPIIEIKVWDNFRLNENSELTEKKITQRKELIKNYYEKKIFARLIGDYSSKEYLEMIKIAELKKRVKDLEEDSVQQNITLQQYKQNIDSLVVKNTNLNSQLCNKDMELITLKNELEAVKKSFWYKLYNKFKK